MKPKLQKGETNVFECGCYVGQHHRAKTYYITYCPLHFEAHRLFAALRSINAEATDVNDDRYENILFRIAKTSAIALDRVERLKEER